MGKNKLNRRYLTSGVVVLAVAGLCVLVLTQGGGAKAAKTTYVQSEFSGLNNRLVPAGSGSSISSAFYNLGSCAISLDHEKGAVNVTSKLKQKVATLANAADGVSIKQIGEKQLTLKTNDGPKKYTLYQYALKGEKTALDNTTGSPYPTARDAQKTKLGYATGGQEFAYLPLSNSYIYINGFCKTAGQLSQTIPALEAIKFNPAS